MHMENDLQVLGNLAKKKDTDKESPVRPISRPSTTFPF